MYLFVLLISTVLGQKKIWGHKCQEVPLIKDFNLKKYAGSKVFMIDVVIIVVMHVHVHI